MDIPIRLNPKLFKALEAVCKNAVNYSGNHKLVRDSVANLTLLLQQEAPELTVEVAALRGFLHRTDPSFEFAASFRSAEQPNGRPKLRTDPIEILGLEPNPSLDSEQISAATAIKKVWNSFGRYLTVAARNLDGTSYHGRALDPLSVMSEETAILWKQAYVPWVTKAKKTWIGRSGCHEAEITLAVVIECIHPHELDSRFRLKTGTALLALQHQLDRFSDYQ